MTTLAMGPCIAWFPRLVPHFRLQDDLPATISYLRTMANTTVSTRTSATRVSETITRPTYTTAAGVHESKYWTSFYFFMASCLIALLFFIAIPFFM